MSQNQELVPYHTVTRDIYAPIGEVWGILGGFGAEKAWYPGCIKLSLEGFGIGSVRRFSYEYPAGPQKGQRYEFSEELTEVDAPNYSMTFRVRRPDYPDMIAFGTTALEFIGPNKTRFIWSSKGSPLPEEYQKGLNEDLELRFSGLIAAIAKQVE
ncbi:hypothetical protein FOPG_14533 [Fusarium oxysporum f. sp. conglutinans race 2 54008]|uniref:Bet v I/Major latex protein domain-containing protein n=6 Tax=Fusarium oxysporum species complex TaxID=171631 RepID=N1SBJ6_FUSC4|nr:uncharacterized protein FOIG_04705 [Fusarium odoratissimum NRRL 54006]EGU80194.1 hypothetical protein FOXB_09277 [Fusarium oxysporum f. sp. conglutinans Fo5176]EMT73610.1 hypothetical protein FOC4_g10002099 [Fusarium odoratissimum]EXL69545.1 hypothetical protein FOPG_14533 [Fusarium oxysporum f. sp. conglutinans race 2 54008]KAF6518639.1 hypothetical protein HZS61_017013 [Fusarium oxysporum f. sp. conglutinans]KAI8404738.1 hypothetical protein FOFC_14210 [Fusarium oxysporum]KAK2126583.1 hy